MHFRRIASLCTEAVSQQEAVMGVTAKRAKATVDRTPAWLEPLPVSEWMRQPVVTVRSDAIVGDAARLMRAPARCVICR